MQVGTAILCGMVGVMMPLMIALFVFAMIRSGCCNDAYETDENDHHSDDAFRPDDDPYDSTESESNAPKQNASKRTWIVVESPDASLSAAVKDM